MPPPPSCPPGADLPADHPLGTAHGCWHPEMERVGPVWLRFRRRVHCNETVAGALLWWSASQRAQLWLDGEPLAEGPPRSDRETWPFVTTPLPDLSPGEHVLAVQVVHWGAAAGKGQIGGPGFWCCAASDPSLVELASDDPGWRCAVDSSRQTWKGETQPELKGHRAVGAGELVDHAAADPHWQTAIDDADWVRPRCFGENHANPWGNRPLGCHLVANRLPAFPRTPLAWARVVDGDLQAASLPLTVAAGQRRRVICDAGHLVTAFPRLTWRGGRGATLTTTANESPIDTERRKPPRHELAGFLLPGHQDRIRCDGREGTWEPAWFRAFRYLVVDVEVGDEELVITDLSAEESAFPLENRLKFELDDVRPWDRLIAIDRATATACAHETFFDCPAWEQAQFPGDGRIQARYHHLVGNEDRLVIKAIADLAASQTPSGLLRSHWPSSFEQNISTYSLQWVGMLFDHWWYRGEAASIAPFLPVARAAVQWFLDRLRSDGLLGRIDEAVFVDWAFPAGCPPQADDGGSSVITAMAAETASQLAELENAAGYPELATRWYQSAAAMRTALGLCWDDRRGLLRDHPTADTCSIHAQVQAALAGFWDRAEAGTILLRALEDPGCRQLATLYYRSHLAEALRRSGRTDLVHGLFADWFAFVDAGVSTWPESDGPTARSDCHAWGCMPQIELVHSIFGLSPAEPGWKRIRCAPNLGALDSGRIHIALPPGDLELELQPDGWRCTSPAPMTLLVPGQPARELPAGTHQS